MGLLNYNKLFDSTYENDDVILLMITTYLIKKLFFEEN